MKKMQKISLIFLILVLIVSGCSNTTDTGETIQETSSSDNKITNKEKTPEEAAKADMEIKYMFNEIPDEYFKKAENQGAIERFDYEIIDENGKEISKFALVYTPYGYNTEDKTTKYNILYLMHGASGSPNTWFGGQNGSTGLSDIIDNMIENGDIEPIIIVTPTYYNRSSGSGFNDGELTEAFQSEFADYLMPAVEERYNTYAKSSSSEGLIAARDHRAFGGFSMGSVTTWYALIHNIDYIKYYMPMSGDCWVQEMMGGRTMPEQTAKTLAESISESGYNTDEYFIYTSTGDEDFAYEALDTMLTSMKELNDTFVFTDNFAEGNIHYDLAEGYLHDYPYGNHYIYNSLKAFFGKDSDSHNTLEDSAAEKAGTKVILSMNDIEVSATLNDTLTAQEFIKLLPYSVTVSRASDDLCGSVTENLPSNPEEGQNSWEIGEIGWFGGWFTILVDNEEKFSNMPGVMIIGKINEEDIPTVQSFTGRIEITVRLAE